MSRHFYFLSALGITACVAWGAVLYLANEKDGVVQKAPVVGKPENPLRFEPAAVGDPVRGNPLIAEVMIADLDQDGLPDIIACDTGANSVRWLRQYPKGAFVEQAIGDPVNSPVHASLCDINGDDKPDLLVASMGLVLPNNDKIGSVVILENLGEGKFRNHVVLENVARVTDVRGADLNGDDKLDLVVGQFGYIEGEIRWMENLGNWQFRSHVLLTEPGTIHTPVADYDGDGQIDFAALVTQDSEAVHLFRGNGRGEFRDSVLWNSTNTGWGSSGLSEGDVNRDGRPDLIMANGDGFNGDYNLPLWHGIQWLENRGAGFFKYHRIADFPGCYSPVCVDLNGDGNMDIVAVSAFNEWRNPASASMMAWLNDGAENFRSIILAHTPTHLITVAAGDLDGDGKPELVTGGFYLYPPYTDMSRITIWSQQGNQK